MAVSVVVAVGFGFWWTHSGSSISLRDRAEAAERSGDRLGALRAWRLVNRTESARARTWLAEAKAALALDLAGQAEIALERASEADSADPEPWRVRLDILRAEGRTVDAVRVGWMAYAAVGPESRRSILRELTLALLLLDAFEEMPDDKAFARLDRWVSADPDDADARIARHRRLAAQARPDDPDLASWTSTLTAILDRDPRQIAAREALVNALIDSGEDDRAGSILDAWPEADRDSRYRRLDARRVLESDPKTAATALERVLVDLPHDARAHAQLARAYRGLGRLDDSNREAALVLKLRERLDTPTIVPRLADDFARLDDPKAIADLADLCRSVGLDRLAEAWSRVEIPSG